MTESVKFFVVWNPKAGPPTFKHGGLGAAISEARRLAGQNVGQSFFVLEAVGVAEIKKPDPFTLFDRDPNEQIQFWQRWMP